MLVANSVSSLNICQRAATNLKIKRMAVNFNFEKLITLRILCQKINEDETNSAAEISNVKNVLLSMEFDSTPILQQTVLACLYKYLILQEKKITYKEHFLKEIINTLAALFEKTRISKLPLFYNIYAFLFTKIFDVEKNKIKNNVPEEIKLSVVICLKNLIKALSWDILLDLYSKENALKLGQMLYILLELAKLEKLRQLRLESMECIVTLTQVNSESKLHDIVILNEVANIFAHFLPGIVIVMRNLALEDRKSGHKIPMMALRTFGRITVLMMKDYEQNGEELQPDLQYYINEIQDKAKKEIIKPENLNKEQVKDTIANMKRDKAWFKRCDENLKTVIISLQTLTKHQHDNVRFELGDISKHIVENCTKTMPNSIGPVIEILITLSQDESAEISDGCRTTLYNFTEKLSTTSLKILTDNLEEMFFEAIGSLPKLFNGFDEHEQVAALNLVLGYLKIFDSKTLQCVFKSVTHLNHFILILMHISELEVLDNVLLDEYVVQDLEMIYQDKRTPWKKFKYFQSDAVKNKLLSILRTLGASQNFELLFTIITDIYTNDENNRRQATFLLNEILTVAYSDEKLSFISDTINRYMDNDNSCHLVQTSRKPYGEGLNFKENQQNIIQICLHIEGIGKIAQAMTETFDKFLLKTLYPVLEHTGSGNSLLRLAGLQAIANIAIATNCHSVTNLINKNSDYFSYHVIRKLKHFRSSEGPLNVLCVILNYSDMDILVSISDIIDGVLYHSSIESNRERITSYLRIFDVIMKSMHRWLDIKIEVPPFKTRAVKLEEIESFQISNVEPEITDFSDNIMHKSAEEMFKEDMDEDRNDIEELVQEEQYKKPDPPKHIKLTVQILHRSLNFLSSKSTEKQLLALKILNNGVEVIRDWEDELLPIVHLIWGPLVGRFNPETDSLIVNLCFKLLLTLARLSKDFIRSRTAKEVLPNLSKTMITLSKESYLKDKGSTYRYKQAYKLQLVVLEHLGQLLVDLDIGDTYIEKGLSSILPYLSNKQPIPLQKIAVQSCKTIGQYDSKMLDAQFKKLNISLEIKSNVDYIRSFVFK